MEIVLLEQKLCRKMPIDGLILATTGLHIIDIPKLNELLSRDIRYQDNDSFDSFIQREFGDDVIELFNKNLERLREYE